MSIRKKQIWLRPDQADLIVRCLRFVRQKLHTDIADGAFSKVAGPFTSQQIVEILEMLTGEKEA